jgi:hypothetical protein
MNDLNPYQSPKFVDELQEPPLDARTRCADAILYGGVTWLGLAMCGVGITEIAYGPFDHRYEDAVMLMFGLLATPVGAVVGHWTWWNPESKWTVAVAFAGLLGWLAHSTCILLGLV